MVSLWYLYGIFMVFIWYLLRRKSGGTTKHKPRKIISSATQNTMFINFLAKIFVCFVKIA